MKLQVAIVLIFIIIYQVFSSNWVFKTFSILFYITDDLIPTSVTKMYRPREPVCQFYLGVSPTPEPPGDEVKQQPTPYQPRHQPLARQAPPPLPTKPRTDKRSKTNKTRNPSDALITIVNYRTAWCPRESLVNENPTKIITPTLRPGSTGSQKAEREASAHSEGREKPSRDGTGKARSAARRSEEIYPFWMRSDAIHDFLEREYKDLRHRFINNPGGSIITPVRR